MTFRLFALFALLGAGSGLLAGPADAPAPLPAASIPLQGRIVDFRYYSPGDVYSVAVPVLHGDKAEIKDNGEIVVFKDDRATLLTIAAFAMPRIAQWEYETSEPREYLIDFFRDNILRDYRREFPGSTIEDARFIPEIFDGALVGFALLPGGSAFAVPPSTAPTAPTAAAKRAHLVFVRNRHIFVVAIELAEHVTRPPGFEATDADENRILFDRLLTVVDAMRFGEKAPAPAATVP